MTIEEMRERRRELGYTYEMLSQISGVPLGTVQKVLGGVTKSPRYDTIQALERALSMPQEMAAVSRSGSCMPQDGGSGGDSSCHAPQAGRDGGDSGGCMSPDSGRRGGGSSGILQEPQTVYGVQPDEQRKGTCGFALEDYYALPEERRAELIDGKFYDLAAPTIMHQILAGRIFACFLTHIDAGEGKCVPLISPVDVQLDQDDRTMVQPDVLILCDREKLHRNVIYGAPDLVVEILSKSTMISDMIVKLNKYYQAGVREYWIVDPAARKIRVYRFDGEESSYQEYEATDTVPVGIWDGVCRVDFGEIFAYLDSLGGLQE